MDLKPLKLARDCPGCGEPFCLDHRAAKHETLGEICWECRRLIRRTGKLYRGKALKQQILQELHEYIVKHGRQPKKADTCPGEKVTWGSVVRYYFKTGIFDLVHSEMFTKFVEGQGGRRIEIKKRAEDNHERNEGNKP